VIKRDKMKMNMMFIRVAPCIHGVIFKSRLFKNGTTIRDHFTKVFEITFCAIN